MSELTEDRAYVRHRRRRGAVLVIGTGAVGSWTAFLLARLGISPLHLVDYKNMQEHNVIRHVLGTWAVGEPKASALAQLIERDFSLCETSGYDLDFQKLSKPEQFWMVRKGQVVVAATDSVECQRRINEACLCAEVPAVYPGIWDQPSTRAAEIGDILWVLPGRHTPCYMCATGWRETGEGTDAGGRGGSITEIMPIASATADVVAALLDRRDRRSLILKPKNNLFIVHGFSPLSFGARRLFAEPGLLQSRAVGPTLSDTCSACGQYLTGEATAANKAVTLYNAAVELVELLRVPDSPIKTVPPLPPLPTQSDFEQRMALVELRPLAIDRLRQLQAQALEAGNRIIQDQYATMGVTVDESSTYPTVSALYVIAEKSERIADELSGPGRSEH